MPIARLFATCATRATWLACSALLATLAACGGGDDEDTPAPAPDPLAVYREQAVAWHACDPSILGVANAVTAQWWSDAGERLQCAQVRAPMDWAHPDRGDVSLAVMRLSASDPARRRGAIFFNPGGPGADGLALTFRFLGAFSDSAPDDPQGALQLRLLAEFDAVGFSPRGLGASTRLQCATNEWLRTVDASAAGFTDANRADRAYNAAKKVEACLKNPLAAHIHTDATARDLDLLRGLVHADQLNYVGYSYGTWLGAWYAGRFPERVGRMVLDSSMDFSRSFEQSVLAQPPAQQRVFDTVVAPYAARHDSTFGLGDTPEAVRALMPALSQPVQDLLWQPLQVEGDTLSPIAAMLLQPGSMDTGLAGLVAARAFDTLLRAAPDPRDTPALRAVIDATVFDAHRPARDASVRTLVHALHQRYHARWVQPTADSLSLSAKDSVNLAVMCNDTPVPSDAATWTALGRDYAQRYPNFFSETFDFPCAYWGVPAATRPALAALSAQPLMFVQSEYDPMTDTEGATRFFDALPQAKRVFVSTEFQHGLYPYNDRCVDPLVTAFLLGDTPAARETVCAGHTLARDRAAAPESPQQAGPATDRYRHPQHARQLLDAFHQGLAR